MHIVRLKLWSNTHHLQQAYAGFSMLHYSNKIKLSQLYSLPGYDLQNAFTEQHLKNHYQSCFIAEVSGTTIVFDMHDSYEVSPYLIEKCDFYFKRSFSLDYIVSNGFEKKCLPYGPFYEVYSNLFDPFLFSRGFNINLEWKRRVRSMMRAFPILDSFTSVSREKYLTSNATSSVNRNIIFSVNLHDPYDNVDRSEDNIESRIELIHQRADLIRKLRREFPGNYIGGAKDNHVSRKFAPDCILEDPTFFNKSNYLTHVKNSSIGISTPGLFNSVGGKFGEYLALGKAIVSYPLGYQQGDGLSSPDNYMEASTVDQVIECCHSLYSEPDLLLSMSQNNINYYQEYLRPDKKILHLLSKVL